MAAITEAVMAAIIESFLTVVILDVQLNFRVNQHNPNFDIAVLACNMQRCLVIR